MKAFWPEIRLTLGSFFNLRYASALKCLSVLLICPSSLPRLLQVLFVCLFWLKWLCVCAVRRGSTDRRPRLLIGQVVGGLNCHGRRRCQNKKTPSAPQGATFSSHVWTQSFCFLFWKCNLLCRWHISPGSLLLWRSEIKVIAETLLQPWTFLWNLTRGFKKGKKKKPAWGEMLKYVYVRVGVAPTRVLSPTACLGEARELFSCWSHDLERSSAASLWADWHLVVASADGRRRGWTFTFFTQTCRQMLSRKKDSCVFWKNSAVFCNKCFWRFFKSWQANVMFIIYAWKCCCSELFYLCSPEGWYWMGIFWNLPLM